MPHHIANADSLRVLSIDIEDDGAVGQKLGQGLAPKFLRRIWHVEDVPAFSRTRGFNVAIAMLFTPLLAD